MADDAWQVEGPIEGRPSLVPSPFDLAKHGYVVEEFFLSGTAWSYRDTGGTGAERDAQAQYRTRLVVCRPDDARRTNFSGSVVVEWFNVSGGGDGNPDWMFMHRHIMRTGGAWVGVSAQRVGVEGGSRTNGGMRAADPERYGSLSHPGDRYSFDMYSHAGLAIRSDPRVLGGLAPLTVISVGESQSAMFLVRYINRIDPIAQVYDAFLVHGRGARAMGRSKDDGTTPEAEPIEAPRVPTITVQSETDVASFQGYKARCDDGPLTRFWEIAGAAHFDTWGLLVAGEDDGTAPPARLAELAGSDASSMFAAAEPLNSGPQQHYVLQAALAHLERWSKGGDPAPHAPYLELIVDADGAEFERDEHGIARGGIRTPWVDVPIAVLSGLGAKGEGFAGLFGVTRPFSAEKLARLYPGGRDEYVNRFAAAARQATAEGFLLEDDVDEAIAVAAASWPDG